MSFIAVGSNIYMVGGSRLYTPGGTSPTDDVFVYNTLTSHFVRGPRLNSGKCYPILIAIGPKIYVLSRKMHDLMKHSYLDPEPRFEVLDTRDFDLNAPDGSASWSPLPPPQFPSPSASREYGIDAYVVYYDSNIIFISMPAVGTYGYDVIDKRWHHISKEQLPFKGQANYLTESTDPSLCYAASAKSCRFCAYKLHYDFHARSLSIQEIVTVHFHVPLESIPPPHLYQLSEVFILSLRDNRVLFVVGGLDKIAYNRYVDNSPVYRYVKLTCDEICKAKLLSTMNDKRKRKLKRGAMASLTKKKKGKRLEKMALVRPTYQQLFRRIGKKVMKENDEEEEKHGREELEFSNLWKRSYFAGPMTHVKLHITAALFITARHGGRTPR